MSETVTECFHSKIAVCGIAFKLVCIGYSSQHLKIPMDLDSGSVLDKHRITVRYNCSLCVYIIESGQLYTKTEFRDRSFSQTARMSTLA